MRLQANQKGKLWYTTKSLTERTTNFFSRQAICYLLVIPEDFLLNSVGSKPEKHFCLQHLLNTRMELSNHFAASKR